MHAHRTGSTRANQRAASCAAADQLSPQDVAQHSRRSAIRYIDWLESELRLLPQRHPLRREFAEQLDELKARRDA